MRVISFDNLFIFICVNDVGRITRQTSDIPPAAAVANASLPLMSFTE